MSEHGKEKIAIILFNLGGPDGLNSVRPFLYNLFSDKWIIRAPYFIRKLIALFISCTRVKLAKENYSLMGGKSPLLQETQKQSKALEQELRKIGIQYFEIFISMRYWHPFSYEVVERIKKYEPDKIVYLPLYPQASSSTTLSSFEDFDNELQNTYPGKDVRKIGCYFNDEGFILSHVELIKEALKPLEGNGAIRILFSAHSIPKKFVKQGDPYEWQINMTYNAIKKELKNIDHQTILCYQSKVGPIEWLSPSTEEEVEVAAKEGMNILVVPIAFVSEHIETLVELDIEYKSIAEKYGVKYHRVKALGDNEIFIKSLARYVGEAILGDKKTLGFCTQKCQDKFVNCLCKE